MTGNGNSRQLQSRIYATEADFPTVGKKGIWYFDRSTGTPYIWDGTAYQDIDPVADDIWERAGTVITAQNAGDTLDMETGDIKVNSITESSSGVGVTIESIKLEDSVLSSNTNLDLKSSLATGCVRILDNGDTPVFSYCNQTDIFTFSDTVTIGVGNKIEVNTIDTYNSIAGVTVEGVPILNGSIGSTGTRVTKGWFTDLEVTNYPTVNGTAISNQTLRTSDSVSFDAIEVDDLYILNGGMQNGGSNIVIQVNGGYDLQLNTSAGGSITSTTDIISLQAINGDVTLDASDNINLTASVNVNITGKIAHVSTIRDTINQSVADEASVTLPDLSVGVAQIIIGDMEEYATLFWDTSGARTLAYNSGNVVKTDTDTKLCILDLGTQVSIKNRLGSAKQIKVYYSYSTS